MTLTSYQTAADVDALSHVLSALARADPAALAEHMDRLKLQAVRFDLIIRSIGERDAI